MVNESRMPTASHTIPFRESSMVDTREQKAPRTLHTHTHSHLYILSFALLSATQRSTYIHSARKIKCYFTFVNSIYCSEETHLTWLVSWRILNLILNFKTVIRISARFADTPQRAANSPGWYSVGTHSKRERECRDERIDTQKNYVFTNECWRYGWVGIQFAKTDGHACRYCFFFSVDCRSTLFMLFVVRIFCAHEVRFIVCTAE